MNLLLSAPAWLAGLLYVLLVAAALQDGWKMKISNWVSGAIAVGAFVAVALDAPIVGLWQNLVLFAAMLAAGTFFFGRNWMGGGDVKLLAAGALWCNFSAGWKMLAAVAIAGGIETLLILLLRRFNWPERTLDRFEFLRKRGGVPYGIAIAAGLILAAWWFRRHHYIFSF